MSLIKIKKWKIVVVSFVCVGSMQASFFDKDDKIKITKTVTPYAVGILTAACKPAMVEAAVLNVVRSPIGVSAVVGLSGGYIARNLSYQCSGRAFSTRRMNVAFVAGTLATVAVNGSMEHSSVRNTFLLATGGAILLINAIQAVQDWKNESKRA